MYYNIKLNDKTFHGLISALMLLEALRKTGYTSVGAAPDVDGNWSSLFVSTHDKKFTMPENVSKDLLAKAKDISLNDFCKAMMEEVKLEHERESEDHSLHIAILVQTEDKPIGMDLCVHCIRKAIAGNEKAIKMYSDPRVVRVLLAEFLESKGIDIVPNEEADAELAANAFRGDAEEVQQHLRAELDASTGVKH